MWSHILFNSLKLKDTVRQSAAEMINKKIGHGQWLIIKILTDWSKLHYSLGRDFAPPKCQIVFGRILDISQERQTEWLGDQSIFRLNLMSYQISQSLLLSNIWADSAPLLILENSNASYWPNCFGHNAGYHRKYK